MDRTLRINKKISLLKKTNYLKWIGNNKYIYYWSLANFIVTNNLFLERSIFMSVGGFSNEFKFAQWEDTEFGSRIIPLVYVLPILSTGLYHIHHKKNYDTDKMFFKNEQIYTQKITAKYKPLKINWLAKCMNYIKDIDEIYAKK
jgi:GT2 family glycosyltransferase